MIKANCLNKERGLAHLCISDKDFNIKTGFIFVGMLVLIGITCYTTINRN